MQLKTLLVLASVTTLAAAAPNRLNQRADDTVVVTLPFTTATFTASQDLQSFISEVSASATVTAVPVATPAPTEPPSHLPAPTYSGLFTLTASATIDAPIETAWKVLTDFPQYPEWNPFVRSQVVVDEDKKPLEDQTPGVGEYILMETHIPATFNDKVLPTEAFEQIIHLDEAEHITAWKALFPEWFIKAERWQGLSVTADGKTLYECREVFAGSGAWLVQWFISLNLRKSFDAQAEAMKTRAEQL